MPKKYVRENIKAVQARARKCAAKDAEGAKKKQDAEDATWNDDDKQTLKKKQRKQQETQQRRQRTLQKRLWAKALLEEEMGSTLPVAKQSTSSVKTTQAQIHADIDKRNATAPPTVVKTGKSKSHTEQPLEENTNRVQPDEINTIDEALKGLTIGDTSSGDVNYPAKSLKSLYYSFKQKNLLRLKEENPSLRMPQLKKILFKEWSKSAENPLNKKS